MEERRVHKIFVKQTNPLYGEGNVQVQGDEERSFVMCDFPNDVKIKIGLIEGRRGFTLCANDKNSKEYMKHMLKVAYKELVKLDDKKDYFLTAEEFNEIEEEI